MSPFERKATEIVRLAIKVDKNLEYRGSGDFANLLGTIKIIKQFEALSPGPKKTRGEVLRFLGGESSLVRQIAAINRWLEREGRPSLKVTEEEILDMLLS